MKQIIYLNKSNSKWYMTSEKNYNSYVQNPKLIYEVKEAHSVDDIMEFINNMVSYGFGCHDDYKVIM